MLVLSRKRGQKVQVGDSTITILQTNNGGVRIGFDAPSDVIIRRCELPPIEADSCAPSCPVATDALPLGPYLPQAG